VNGARTVADSHEWENKCKQLLSIRYRDELQLIDASRGGDLGLDAFTRDTGLGFQCYAPLETLNVHERYEKHRDKLTEDLGKLEKNLDELVVILGHTKLRRYVFMVPQFERTLLTHCGKKSNEMKAKKLAIIDDHFDIVVHTAEDYAAELAQLIEVALEPLRLNLPDIDERSRSDWADANVSLVEALTGKIAKFALDSKQQEELRDEFLSHYLQREQLLGQVYDRAPETHVRLERRIHKREELLLVARLMTREPPLEHATTVIDTLTQELLEESKALQAPDAQALSYGTAADWMMRCPLDFN